MSPPSNRELFLMKNFLLRELASQCKLHIPLGTGVFCHSDPNAGARGESTKSPAEHEDDINSEIQQQCWVQWRWAPTALCETEWDSVTWCHTLNTVLLCLEGIQEESKEEKPENMTPWDAVGALVAS